MRQLELPLAYQDAAAVGRWQTAQTLGAEGEPPQEQLTPRRRQVLSLYLRGESRKEIAGRLGVSPNTVRNHIRLIYEQFGFTNRVEALRWALEQPTLARQLLLRNADEVGIVNSNRGRRADREPISLEKLMSEAIAFYQRMVIEDSVETA